MELEDSVTISTHVKYFNILIILCFLIFSFAGVAPAQTDAKDVKELYKAYQKLPSKDIQNRRAVLRTIVADHPDSRTALKAVKNLADLESRGGPWTDLPAKAAVIKGFLAASKWKPAETASLRKDLRKAYAGTGRFDQLAACLTEELNLKPSQSAAQEMTYELGLTLLKLGRRDEAAARLEEAKQLVAKRPRKAARIEYTLARLPGVELPRVDLTALENQAVKAGKLFNRIKPWKSDQEDQAEEVLIQLVRECPLTYHGRRAALKLASRRMRQKKPDQAEEICRAVMADRPLTWEARQAAEKLGKIYYETGQPKKIYALTENQLARALTAADFDRIVRDMAGQIDGYRPWRDLPAKAVFFNYFLEKSPPPEAAESWRKSLLKTYRQMSRYDLVAEELKKDLAAETKKSKTRKLTFQLALNLAMAGRVEEATGLLENLNRELAGKNSTLRKKTDFILARLKAGRVAAVDETARTAQEAQAGKLFRSLIPYQAQDAQITDPIIARLAEECPLTYHGRQAKYKLADIARSRNKDLARYEEILVQLIRDWPQSDEADEAAKTLRKQYRKEDREADEAKLAGWRLDAELDSTAERDRDRARSIAAQWGGAGRWDMAAEWYHRALALTDRFNPRSPKLPAILDRTKGLTYLPAPLRLELVACLLDQGQAGPDTPWAVAEMAGDLVPADNPEGYIWPDLEFANGLFNILVGRFAADEKLLKSFKYKIKDVRETLGDWTVAAKAEQEKFDRKYKDRNRLFSGDCFKLAVLWQRAGQPDKSKAPLERLLKQKRMDFKDRKKAEMILRRLDRLPQTEPTPTEEAAKRRDEARRIYTQLVSLKIDRPKDMPEFEWEKKVIEARKPLAEKLAKGYPETFHGNRAARTEVINCLAQNRDSLEPDCLAKAEDYLHAYPCRPDSQDLWKDLVKITSRDRKKDAARLLAWAARDWAHLFDEDEQELAFKTAQAYQQAGEPAQALPWLKVVLEFDETGESRLAKKAARLTGEIQKAHPELAAAKSDDKPLTADEQNELAGKLFKQAAKTPKSRLKDFKEIYTEIIRRCPEASQVQEAYWRLTNLYLTAYDQPQNEEIIKLLEEFMRRYPDSRIIPHVRRRLVIAYERTKRYCQAADQQRLAVGREEVLIGDPDSQLSAMIKLYIGNLEKCGRPDAVAQWKQIDAAGGSAKEKIGKAKGEGLLDK